MKFPVDAPRDKVLRAFHLLGFRVIREESHLILERQESDGTVTPLVMPNHRVIKSGTLRAILTQVGNSRDEFLGAFYKS